MTVILSDLSSSFPKILMHETIPKINKGTERYSICSMPKLNKLYSRTLSNMTSYLRNIDIIIQAPSPRKGIIMRATLATKPPQTL